MNKKRFGYGGSAQHSGLPKGIRSVNPAFTPDQFRRFAAIVNKTLADLTELDRVESNNERIIMSVKSVSVAVMLENTYPSAARESKEEKKVTASRRRRRGR